MKKLFLIMSIVFIAYILISCEPATGIRYTFPTSAYFIFPQSLAFGFIPEDIGTIHAYQAATIDYENFAGASSSYTETYGYVGAIYNVGGEAKYIEYSRFWDADMQKNIGYVPPLYALKWDEPPFQYGEKVYFTFKYPNLDPVSDTVKIPERFGNLRVDRDTFSLSYGCNIKWDNKDTELVMLSIKMMYMPQGGKPLVINSGFINYYPNTGNINFSKELIDSIKISPQVNYIFFYLEKANISYKKFDNGKKISATLGHTQEITSVWVKE